jgi:predicted peptidase
MTRREVISLMGAMPLAGWTTSQDAPSAPPLASGGPHSPERRALIDAFRRKTAGLADRFESRVYNGSRPMPYRLFRPVGTARVPLVLYLHGSGGLGDDNRKQLTLGNFFGTHVWALPENQQRFPCYVLAPQTAIGWAGYRESPGGGPARLVPGFGEGARLALEIAQALAREFAIDDRRIYVTGQSMGGAGAWNLIAHRPEVFAAAVICCGSRTEDDVKSALRVPLWNFHGKADRTVPVALSRERIAALRNAGGQPLATEYAGVDHNVWEWAYTEPALPDWLFAQRRAA